MRPGHPDWHRQVGLQIRAGVYKRECDLMGADVAGLAVHVASRARSAAAPGEILVSHTVRDLAVGSGLELIDRGIHELRGVSGDCPCLRLLTDRRTSAPP